MSEVNNQRKGVTMFLVDVSNLPGDLNQSEADQLAKLATNRGVLSVQPACMRSTAVFAASAEETHYLEPGPNYDCQTGYPIKARAIRRIKKNELNKIGAEYNLVFIEGVNDFASTLANLNLVIDRVSHSGIVVLRGCTPMSGMRQAARSFFHRSPDRMIGSTAVYLMEGYFPGRILHIVTPSMRPNNLGFISRSIHSIRFNLPTWSVRWHVGFDRSIDYLDNVPQISSLFRQSPGGANGNPGRNDALEMIREGWVHFLDDDNDIHPEFVKGLSSFASGETAEQIAVFNQYHKDGTLRLKANPMAGPGEIDTAQFVAWRSAIGHIRWHPSAYAADYTFFKDITANARAAVAPGGVYYNKLRV